MKRRNPEFWKKAGLCAGTVAVSAALLTGCDWFSPELNEPACVYGPPEFYEDNYDPADNDPGEVYGPPHLEDDDYDPVENLPAPVYGPPEDMAGQG